LFGPTREELNPNKSLENIDLGTCCGQNTPEFTLADGIQFYEDAYLEMPVSAPSRF